MIPKEKIWVAGGVGSPHIIANSREGINWTGSTSGDAVFSGIQCISVAYNGSDLWVACGFDTVHTIATSSDGISWTGSTSGDAVFAGGQGNTVAFGNGMWVAGGNGAHIMATSNDGITWTGSTSGDAVFEGNSCLSLAYNGTNLWVAGSGVGSSYYTATSSDGITWTGSTSCNALFGEGYCSSIAFGNGLWVACGAGGVHKLATSNDGITWTGSTSGDAAFAGGYCYAVAYNGRDLWVSGGGAGSAHTIATSNDGITWTGSTSGDEVFGGGYCTAVAYNGTDLWVVAGDGAHKLATSSDGITWTSSTSGDAVISGGYCTVAFGETSTTVCVLRDTPICVSEFNGVQTYKKIQDLREGDYIIGAISNMPKKIVTVVSSTHKYAQIESPNVPYKIPADFYTKHLPVQDIYISGTHAIVLTNSKKEPILVSVSHTKKFVPATADELSAFGYPDITYYNIELEQADGMYVGGVPVETLTLRTSLNL